MYNTFLLFLIYCGVVGFAALLLLLFIKKAVLEMTDLIFLKKIVIMTFVIFIIIVSIAFALFIKWRPFDSKKPYNAYEVLLEYKPSFGTNIPNSMKERLILCQEFGKNIDNYVGVQEKTLYLKYFCEMIYGDFNDADSLKEFLSKYKNIYNTVYSKGDSLGSIKEGILCMIDKFGLSVNDPEFCIDQTFKAVEYYLTLNK